MTVRAGHQRRASTAWGRCTRLDTWSRRPDNQTLSVTQAQQPNHCKLGESSNEGHAGLVHMLRIHWEWLHLVGGKSR